MKTSFIWLAIVGLISENNAIQLEQQISIGFVDDIVKALAEADKKEEEDERKSAKVAVPESKPIVSAPVITKKPEPTPLVDDSIPLDTAAIGQYAEVIADAAEDNVPEKAVEYHNNMDDKV